MTNFCVEALNAVTSKMDMPALFVKTGYAGWSDDTEGKRLKLRGFPDFSFKNCVTESVLSSCEAGARNPHEKVFPKKAEEDKEDPSQRTKASNVEIPSTPPRPNPKQMTLFGKPAEADGAPKGKRRRMD